MENVSLIAAIGGNNEIGCGNRLIWHLPGDLKFFRDMTIGKDIVMGKNTFYSLPKMLPCRRHIVLTRGDIVNDDVFVFRSKIELIDYLNDLKKEVMIIGGASIYAQLIDVADKMYLTHIDSTYEQADVFFPNFNHDEWDKELLGTNADNGISYKHVLYKRKRIGRSL